VNAITTIQEGATQPLPLTNSETIAAVECTVRALHGDGPISAELRVLGSQARWSGVFEDASALAREAAKVELSTMSDNLYVSVNPVTPGPQMSRGQLRKARSGGAVTDRDIPLLRWLVFDVDPVRATGVSASDSEKTAAVQVAQQLRAHFADLGWPLPLVADSGSGAHVLFPLPDLPNTDANRALTKAVTLRAAQLFDTAEAKVDKSVCNPARILRLWSSSNRKGSPTAERPWRRSALLEHPERVALTVEQLTRFIQGDADSNAPTVPAGVPLPEWDGAGGLVFPMVAYLEAAHVMIKSGPVDYNGGKKWLIVCPFYPSHHLTNEVSAFVDASGGPGFFCMHDSCQDKAGFHAFDKALKKQLAEDTAAITAIDALEAREGWSSTTEGLYQVTRGGAQRMRLGSQLHVVARVRDVDSAGWGYVLRWTAADGKTKELVVSAGELFGDPRAAISKMVDAGYSIELKRGVAEALVVYINSATPPVELRVDRPGWHGNSYIFPDELIQPRDGAVQERVHFTSSSAAAAAYGVAGTLDEWQQAIGRYCVGNSRLVLAASAAFAGPLLRPTGNETGGLHLCGGSSIGKSTALHVAGSVCGGGGAGGYTGQWRCTANGLEGVAVAHNDGLLVLDEIGQLSGKEVASAVYMLANERGKARANKTGDAAATKNWTTMVLSSGELSLSAHATDAGVKIKAGTEVRLLTIPADAGRRGLGLYEDTHNFTSAQDAVAQVVESIDPTAEAAALSDHLKAKAKVVYGTPLRAFVRWFVENRDDALSLAAALQEKFRAEYVPANASGEIVRAAARFSLLAAAGELATESGATGWEPGEATNAAGVCFRAWLAERDGGTSVGGDLEAGVRQALSIIEQHGARFQPIHQTFETRDRLGFRLEEHGLIKHFVLRGPFEAEVCRGFNYKTVRDELIKRGYMIAGTEAARPGQQQVRLPGLGKQRVYVMTRPDDAFEALAVAA